MLLLAMRLAKIPMVFPVCSLKRLFLSDVSKMIAQLLPFYILESDDLRGDVVTNAQADRAVGDISLPFGSHLCVRGQVRVGSEVLFRNGQLSNPFMFKTTEETYLRQVVGNFLISVISTQPIQGFYNTTSDIIQKDQVDRGISGQSAIGRKTAISLEKVRDRVVGDLGVNGVIAVAAEVVGGDIAGCGGGLTSDDAAARVRTLGDEIVAGHRRVDAAIERGVHLGETE